MSLLLTALLARAAVASDGAAEAAVHAPQDVIWVLVCAALVFFMQAGFMCVEAGMVSAKDSINVAIKNMADFVLAIIAFWSIGFGLMFGASDNGFVGTEGYFIDAGSSHWVAAFFVFQGVFVGTAATIQSGAIAGRMKFGAYLVMGFLISALIYPVSGHWAWGSLLHGDQAAGWLEGVGFHDFAGSSVVHLAGAAIAVAGLRVLGPRLGRFDDQGKPRTLQPSNLPMVFLGTFILFMGWFGFNAGSTLEATPAVARIAMNTIVAAVFGGLVSTAACWALGEHRRPEPSFVSNGVLGGLVAITAGADVVPTWGAALIGAGAGAVVWAGSELNLRRLKLDDAVDAVAVHGYCGAFGTLALSAFLPGAWWATLGVQLLGVVAIAGWCFGVSSLGFAALSWVFGGLRVSEEDERMGLNVAEHGASSSLLDLAVSMMRIKDAQKYGPELKVDVEPGTDTADVASCYNDLLDALQGAQSQTRQAMGDLQLSLSQNRAVLDAVGQGLVVVGRDGALTGTCSARIEGWFGAPTPGQSLLSWLQPHAPDFAEWLALGWEGIDDGFMPLAVVLDQLPDRFELGGRSFELEYRPMHGPGADSADDDAVEHLLVVFTDRTEALAAERERARQAEIVEVFSRVQRDRQGFLNFFRESGAIVARLLAGGEDERVVKRDVHTVKGNCAVFGVSSVARMCHDVETEAADGDGAISHEGLARVAAAWQDFTDRVTAFIELGDAGVVQVDRNDYDAVCSAVARGLHHGELAIMLERWTWEPVDARLVDFGQVATALARRLGKGEVNVRVDAGSLRVPPGRLDAFWTTFVHVVRNAVDHGLEEADARTSAGKSPGGLLQLKAWRDDSWLTIETTDDGGGIAWHKLAEKLEGLGLPSNTPAELEAALWMDGLSSREQATETSGRGVGMGAVKAAVEAMDGQVAVRSTKGVGTTFTFRLPTERIFGDSVEHLRLDRVRSIGRTA